MRHDERHAALAAYAFWCKLEQTGKSKGLLYSCYKQLFNVTEDAFNCPACVVAERLAKRGRESCIFCPCEWSAVDCNSDGSPFYDWQPTPTWSDERKRTAGDVANIMRKWCEDVGVIAPRSW